MTIMDQSTGEVQAIVGGRGNRAGNRTWNRATKTCGKIMGIVPGVLAVIFKFFWVWGKHPCRMMHHLQSEIKHIIITHIHSRFYKHPESNYKIHQYCDCKNTSGYWCGSGI